MSTEPEWVELTALLEAMPWGRSIYTILRVNRSLEEAARAAGTRRVEGTIDDVPVNVAVNRADVLPDAFIYAGKPLQRRLGARPGDLVHCRLRPADPDDVLLAEDVNLLSPTLAGSPPSNAGDRGSGGASSSPSRQRSRRRPAAGASPRCSARCRPTDRESSHHPATLHQPGRAFTPATGRKLGMMGVDDPRGSAV